MSNRSNAVKLTLGLAAAAFIAVVALGTPDRAATSEKDGQSGNTVARHGDFPESVEKRAPIAPEQARSITEALEKAPGIEELKKEYVKLDRAEILERIQRIDAEIDEARWVERANAAELSPRELGELGQLLRQRTALIAAKIELRQRAKRKA